MFNSRKKASIEQTQVRAEIKERERKQTAIFKQRERKALQESNAKIEALEARIETLENA